MGDQRPLSEKQSTGKGTEMGKCAVQVGSGEDPGAWGCGQSPLVWGLEPGGSALV